MFSLYVRNMNAAPAAIGFLAWEYWLSGLFLCEVRPFDLDLVCSTLGLCLIF